MLRYSRNTLLHFLGEKNLKNIRLKSLHTPPSSQIPRLFLPKSIHFGSVVVYLNLSLCIYMCIIYSNIFGFRVCFLFFTQRCHCTCYYTTFFFSLNSVLEVLQSLHLHLLHSFKLLLSSPIIWSLELFFATTNVTTHILDHASLYLCADVFLVSIPRSRLFGQFYLVLSNSFPHTLATSRYYQPFKHFTIWWMQNVMSLSL